MNYQQPTMRSTVTNNGAVPPPPPANEKLLLDRLRSNDPSLKKLTLVHPPNEYFGKTNNGNGNDDDDDNLESFLDALRGNRTVEYVLLERRFIRGLRNAEEYESILLALGKLASLTEMEIWGSNLPLSVLFRAVQPARKLVRLGLGTVTLIDDDDGSLDCSALRNHPTLERFYLSDFRLSSTTRQQQDAELGNEGRSGTNDDDNSEGTEDTRLDSLWNALSTCSRLEKVELFAYRHGDGDGDGDMPWSPGALAMLATSRSVQHITLRRLGLKHQHVQAFSNALRTKHCSNDDADESSALSALRVLDLNENKLGDAGCFAIMKAVVGNSNAGNVREVSLRKNGLTSSGCRTVAALLARTNTTTNLNSTRGPEKLNLACNDIGDEGAVALADLVLSKQQHPDSSCSLKHLELNRTGLTDKGCVPLADALVGNNVLLSLGLSNNEMTDQSYVAFASALKTNRTLRSINLQALQRTSVGRAGQQQHQPLMVDLRALRGASVSQAGYQALVDMLRDNYVLQTVATPPLRTKHAHYAILRTFLRLNHAGRKHLLQDGTATAAEWVDAIAAVQDDFNAIVYLVQANPGLCQNKRA